MKAIILAGGYATRLWPLTRDVAKPLLPLGKKRVIEYLIDELIKCENIDRIYVSTNYYYSKQFEGWLNTKNYKNVEIIVEKTVREEEKLGAIGALSMLFRDLPRDDYLVLAGDNHSSMLISDFIKFFERKKAFIVAAYDIGDLFKATHYGVLRVDSENKVIDFEEKPKKPKSTLIATAYYAVPAEVIDKYHEYVSLGHNKDAPGKFIEWYHRVGCVYAYIFRGYWFDIGKPDTYLETFKHVVTDSYISKKAKIDSSEVIDPVIVEDNVEIINSKIGPYVYIGSETRIENSSLKNSIVLERNVIKSSLIDHTLLSFNVLIKNSKLINSNIGGYSKITTTK